MISERWSHRKRRRGASGKSIAMSVTGVEGEVTAVLSKKVSDPSLRVMATLLVVVLLAGIGATKRVTGIVETTSARRLKATQQYRLHGG